MKQIQGWYAVAENRRIAEGVYEMTLLGDTRALTAPGQFVNVRLDGLFLRRPFSVCDWDERGLTILYKVVGRGTGQMSACKPGDSLDLLVGLGNGFDPRHGEKPLLIGGGMGVAPLYALAKALLARGVKPRAALGFARAEDVFYTERFEALGVPAALVTVDGSMGEKGFVTDAIAAGELDYDYFYACGPQPMLRAVSAVCSTEGQLSFEERMGCGFGACMGCSCKTLTGYKRICKEGPVLLKSELMWD